MTCYKCDLTFEQFSDLSDHTAANHPARILFPCNECQLSFGNLAILEEHIYSEHQSNTIPQVDGPCQDLSEASKVLYSNNRTAGFTFNHEKQTEKITKDAEINDFEVNINNSDQNATIKCSTGFYIQVARACFVTLYKSSVITRSKTAMCHNH